MADHQGLHNDDIVKLLSAIGGRKLNDYHNKAILMTFIDSGLRLGELANLKVG